MEQFDIISAFNTYATSKGWHGVYGFNNFESNLQTIRQYSQDEYCFIFDFKADPVWGNNVIQEIKYTCLLMLGRKSDLAGTQSNLDETAQQKYDRRLKELSQGLALAIKGIACNNGLLVESSPIAVDINVFDSNIDFAITQNTIFIQ
jgi:hypothetical protein